MDFACRDIRLKPGSVVDISFNVGSSLYEIYGFRWSRFDELPLLVDRLYKKVRSDALIGPLFDEVATVGWLHHD